MNSEESGKLEPGTKVEQMTIDYDGNIYAEPEEFDIAIIDTVCENCDKWYGMSEGKKQSTCPYCGHIMSYE